MQPTESAATVKYAEGLVSVINDSLNTANHSENISIRESEIKKAHKSLMRLKELVSSNSYIEFTRLQETENNIIELEAETQHLADINSDKKEQILQEIEERRLKAEKASILLTQSEEECFENYYKLEHIILDVTYKSDITTEERTGSIPLCAISMQSHRIGSIACKLELFGYCLMLTTVATKEVVVKAIFDPLIINSISNSYRSCTISATNSKKIIESWWDNYSVIPGIELHLDEIAILNKFNLIMLPEIYNIINEHFSAINEFKPYLENYLAWEKYKENTKNFLNIEKDWVSNANKFYSTVNQLLDDSDLVEMGKSFIDEFAVNLYADSYYLAKTEDIINLTNSEFAFTDLFLMSTKISRDSVFNTSNYSNAIIDKIGKEVDFYLTSNLPMFTRIIKENTNILDNNQEFFVTFNFLYNIAIEQLAQKWEYEYKQHFDDIIKLTLDKAIERYCSIDDIVHRDNVIIGKFIYYLIKHGKFENNDRNYFTCWEIVFPKLNHVLENKKFSNFVNRLKTSTTNSQIKYTINDVDLMDGLEFEKFIAELFSKMGYESEITKASGDQGIDVIASKNGNTIGIQAKCYSSTVGNSAIQEVVAGKVHYRLDKAIVVTNNFFTDSAQQLAKSNSIILWDRHILKEKIDENFTPSTT